MTAEVTELTLKVDSSGVAKAGDTLDKFANSGRRAEESASNVEKAAKRVKLAFDGVVASQIVRTVIAAADSYKNLNARLQLATKSSEEFARAQGEIFSIAQRTRTPLIQTADLYASLARSTQTLAVSQNDLLGVTETINQAIQLSGANAQSSTAALVQLSQAFASGVLRGEELNSVMEQAPRLAKAIADGLGVTIGQLRKLGADGKITSEAVFKALQSSRDSISNEFSRLPVTISGATTKAANSLTQLIGVLDEASGASAAVASGISAMATAFDTLAKSVREGGSIVTMFGVIAGAGTAVAILRTASAITGAGGIVVAITRVRTAMIALNAVLAANPLGLALVLGSAIVGGVVAANRSPDIEKLTKDLQDAERGLKEAQESGQASRVNYWETRVKLLQKDLARLRAGTTDVEDEIRRLQNRYPASTVVKSIVSDFDKAKRALQDLARQEEIERQANQSALDMLAARSSQESELYQQRLQFRRELDSMGRGNVARDRNAGVQQIEDKYAAQERQLDDARIRGQIDPREYDEQLALIRSFRTKALAEFDVYYTEKKKKEADWRLGLSDSLRSYADESENVYKQINNAATNALMGMEDAFVELAKTGKLSFKDMADAIIADLVRIAIRQSVIAPFANSVGSFFGPVKNAKGGVYNSPSLSAYSNGIYNSPQFFAFAKGGGVFAEAGPEAIMPLARGAGGSLGVRAVGSSSPVSIEINNYSGASVVQREVSDGRGGRSIQVQIGDATASELGRSGSSSNNMLRNGFGLSQTLVRR